MKHLPFNMREILSKWYHVIDQKLCAVCARSRFLTSIYYVIFSDSFRREQQAFAAGRVAYEKSLRSPQGSMAILRRNIHRLEKGLLMRPRRVPFGRDYIKETVYAFGVAVAQGQMMDPQEITWAQDVLTEYFRVHGEIPEIARLVPEGLGTCEQDFAPSSAKIPYKRDLAQPCPVKCDQLLALAIRRRSVRWFQQRPVRRELLDQALAVALQAPSACNRQPFEFRIIDEAALVARVLALPPGTTGYSENVPVVIVVIGQQRNYFKERDRHLIYIDASLAVMGFILALETLGLGSCCINWPDIESNERQMKDLLRLDTDERPIMLIAVGYPDPDGMVACSTKKSLSYVRGFNLEPRSHRA